MENVICPYPGLRPFNEDEAIFFKGRDEHIEQIIHQLEEKKFLMLTGASGDGKSSLVYAGVIPNARAGFFKAKFNNWIVADFRPERNPLSNFAQSLTKQFNLSDVDKVQKELSYGFSALIDLYKSTPYWVDQNAESFKTVDPTEQKKLKRKGANLLILVDQFEEFFTNPENYSNGKTSVESQTVVNLLLETSKIALEQDIPIYIICTMRSDYIGQCASFRGLPEYIGYSQFFVPRLKRKEIYQVIEEPALLNGNKISKRLVEMLINEMDDGIDQLPVLQHALNQVWQKAEKGKVEMDVIHFAKVSGIPKNQLNANDKKEFEIWFETIPEFKKEFFAAPSLDNVLDAHANELFETAADAVNNVHGRTIISADDAKLIIQVVFKCLTKIDESRAVRNRMTLQEVTQIINRSDITSAVVGQVLNVFRLQGNTFLKPFITDDAISRELNSDSVLDITHESLIRNWNKLMQWAKEEYDNLLIFQDFNKQLQRWVSNNKSSGYLLPIGPLTYFEGWFNKVNPNKYWLARYDERDIPKEQKISDAEQTLNNINLFIKRSARRLFFSRTVLKYGADTLIAVFGLVLLMFSCTYYYFDFQTKQNDYVIEDITTKGLDLLKSDKVKNSVKAHFLINYERLHPGTTENILNSLQNDTLAYDLAATYFNLINNYNDNGTKPHVLGHRLIMYMDSTLNSLVGEDPKKINGNISRINDHVKLCAYLYFHKRSEASHVILNNNLKHVEKYLMHGVNDPEHTNTEQFNSAIDIWLALSEVDSTALRDLIVNISPFSNTGLLTFNSLYPKDQNVKADYQHYLTHKGGYQILSFLYAAKGDYPSLHRCLDSLFKYNPEYNKIYGNGIWAINNVLLKYQRVPSAEFESVANKFFAKFPSEMNAKLWTKELVNNQLRQKMMLNDRKSDVQENILAFFIPEEKKQLLFNDYGDVLLETFKNDNEKKINAAIYQKKLAMYFIEMKKDTAKANRYFNAAFELYKELPEAFLKQNYILYDFKNEPVIEGEKIPNSMAFLFPIPIGDYAWNIYGTNFWECDASGCYERPMNFDLPFFKYILDNKLTHLYSTKEELRLLEKFCYIMINSISPQTLHAKRKVYNNYHLLVDLIKSSKTEKDILDENFVQLVNLQEAVLHKDSVKAKLAYTSINFSKVLDPSFQKIEGTKDQVHRSLIKSLYLYLAENNKNDEAFKVHKMILDPWEKRNSLIDAAYKLVENDNIGNAFVYLDSILPQIKAKPKFGMKLFRVFGKIGGAVTYNAAFGIFKDIDDKLKPRGLSNLIWGVSHAGLYYTASSFIPETVSRVNELSLYNEILHAEVEQQVKIKGQGEMEIWMKYDQRHYGEFIAQNYEIQGEHFDSFSD